MADTFRLSLKKDIGEIMPLLVIAAVVLLRDSSTCSDREAR